jgi:Cu2+-exporting ATPase
MSDTTLLSGVTLPPLTSKQQTDCWCYHCPLAVPAGVDYQLEIEGKHRRMCCPGCVAAASMILGAKLTGYYQYRDICDTNEVASPAETDQRTFEAYGKPDYMQQYCRELEQGTEVDLIISGIRCAACVWLLKKLLSAKNGVSHVSVNFGNHRAYLTFDPSVLDIPTIFTQIAQLGYQAFPYVASIEENLYQQQKRTLLKALGVSGIGVMQVIMFTIALYAGALRALLMARMNFTDRCCVGRLCLSRRR